MIPEDAALGRVPGVAKAFSLEGLPTPGFARGATWNSEGLTVVSGQGAIHGCGHGDGNRNFQCQTITGPVLPVSGSLPAVVVNAGNDMQHFAAVAMEGGEVNLMKLGFSWELTGKVQLPFNEDQPERPSVVALSAAEDHLIVTASDGA